MSGKIQGTSIEIDIVLNDKNLIKYLENIKKSFVDINKASSDCFNSISKDIGKNDKLLNSFSLKLKGLEFQKLQNNFALLSVYFKNLEKDIDRLIEKSSKKKKKEKNLPMKLNNEKKIESPKEENSFLDQYTTSISSIALAIDSLNSKKLIKLFEPLKKGNLIIINLKKIKEALVEITHVDGKFNFLKSLKFGALTAGLYLANFLFQKFNNYISNNEKVMKSWESTIKKVKEVLKSLGNILLDFLLALLGIDSENFDDSLVKTFDKIGLALDSLKEKLEKVRKWIHDNKDEIKSFGNTIKEWGPILLGVTAIAWGLFSPLNAILLAIALTPVLIEELKKTKETIKDLQKDGDWQKFLKKNEKKSSFLMGEASFKILTSIDTKDLNKENVMNTLELNKKNIMNTLINNVKDGLFGKVSLEGINALVEKIKELPKIFSNNTENIKIIISNLWQWLKSKFNEGIEYIITKLSEMPLGLIPFILSLGTAGGLLQDIIGLSGTVITLTLQLIKKGVTGDLINGVSNGIINGAKLQKDTFNNMIKTKEQFTGTNYFPGGLTTINEKGDELILGPTGMVVANNPSTTNIMRDLATVKGNLSHINFKMNGENPKNSGNNIIVNIGNISNKSDIDYLTRQLSMLDLS